MFHCRSEARYLLAAAVLVVGVERANLRFPIWNTPLKEEKKTTGFEDWIRKYSEAPQREIEAEGVALARERRDTMRSLIESDPQRAWESRISWKARQRLPAAVQAELETLVSVTGRLEVFAATPLPGQTNGFRPVIRRAAIAGRNYEAFVYGRRVNQPTGDNISLHGVAIDNVIALSDSSVRLLEPGEPPSPTKTLAAAECPVSGNSTAAAWAESGTQVYQLCSTDHLEALAQMVWQQEALAVTSVSTGAQPALVLIVDFPNLPGATTTVSNALQVMNQVDLFYRSNSFGALSIGPLDVTPAMRLSRETDYYLQRGQATLMDEAIMLAQGLGYVASNYRFVIVTFANIGFPWSGIGTVGGREAFMQGPTFRLLTVQHEFGHNLGVWHAGGWLTDDESIIGPGRHIEYGNEFDIMGSGTGHLNGAFKFILGWLQESNVATAWAAGVYRIHALDIGGGLAADKAYTLRIPAGPSLHRLPSDYWIDYRKQFPDLGASSGALIHWATNSVGIGHSHLLDMNPAGVYGFRDAALGVGRTFFDNLRGISVTPIAKGPDWLDIAVKFPPTNNWPPSITLNASALNVNPGQPVQFTATASDLNGDTLAYYWDFDDGSVLDTSLNQPSATKTWTSPREYSVRCVASDMKGGEASASVLIRVGNPATYHVAGSVPGIAGVRVHNGLSGPEYRATYTDSEGRFALTGLPAGNYVIGAARTDVAFEPLFENPVRVGPASVDGLLFAAHATDVLFITGFSPSSGTIGTEVLIEGVNLQSVTSVKFGTVSAVFSREGPTRVRSWVPSGAASAPIVVTGPPGTDISRRMFGVIPTLPVFTQQPLSQTNGYTLSTYLTASVSGSGPLTIQWRKDGVDIPGETNTNLAIINLASNHAGVYDIVARNSVGAVTSAPAWLILETRATLGDMIELPELTWITGAPRSWLTQSNITRDGIDAAESALLETASDESWLQTTVTFSQQTLVRFWCRHSFYGSLELASVGRNSLFRSGGGPGNTNWTQGSLMLDPGEHTLRFRASRESSPGPYRAWLDQVTFTTGTAPVITRQPEDVTVAEYREATLSVEATGVPPPRFQWYRWSQPVFGGFTPERIFGATNSSLTVFPGPDDYEDPYFVIVENEFGFVTSRMTRVFTFPPPEVTILSPRHNSEVLATDFTVRVRASGPFPIESVGLSIWYDYGEVLAAEYETEAPGPDGDYQFRITEFVPGRDVTLVVWARDSAGVVSDSATATISLALPLVTNGSIWKYLDGGRCPGSEWILPTYCDEGWSNGMAPFGFGVYPAQGEGTRIEFGATTFYRHKFLVPDPESLSNIVVRLRCVGGAIVYLNRQELLRRNLPDGKIDFLTPGGPGDPDLVFKYRLDPAGLAQGENLLAVEVHAPFPPEDMLFDLALVADLAPGPPEIIVTSPRNGQLITNSQFTITAEIFDQDHDIVDVRFLIDGFEFAADVTPPWSAVFSNLPPAGSPPWTYYYSSWYNLEVYAWDDTGAAGYRLVTIARQPVPGIIDLVRRREKWFRLADFLSEPDPGWQAERWVNSHPDWSEVYTPVQWWVLGGKNTGWFRKHFELPARVRCTNLVLSLFGELSDGAIVYLNGIEVFRHNLPAGTIHSDQLTGLPQDFFGYVRHDLGPAALRTGTNIIAVETHQNATNAAGRFTFDLALAGMVEENPVGLAIEPAGPGPFFRLSWDTVYWHAARLEEADSLDEYWRLSAISAGQPFAIEPGTQKFFRLRWNPIED